MEMKEDHSGPYPGYGLGAMDHFDGYIIYKLIDNDSGILKEEIQYMKELVDRTFKSIDVNQDLGARMCLWISHFF